MSEIKDRQDAASDIDPIVAALADDTQAAAAVEGFDEAAEPADGGVELTAPEAGAPELSGAANGNADEPLAATDLASADDVIGAETLPMQSDEAVHAPIAADEPADAAADFGDEAPAQVIASADIADAIEAALLDEAAEPFAASSFENMPAAYADTVVELDAEVDSADDDAPLLDVELEDGIASVFAALHAAREHSAPVEPLGDLEAADGVTFRLLGELDRLWHRAA
ncbi:MAG: hypothetical protein K0Q69_2146 [Devosia sp.]|jgi:hypothetical protein|nr:hypothetical protein [Devosia sp.]